MIMQSASRENYGRRKEWENASGDFGLPVAIPYAGGTMMASPFVCDLKKTAPRTSKFAPPLDAKVNIAVPNAPLRPESQLGCRDRNGYAIIGNELCTFATKNGGNTMLLP